MPRQNLFKAYSAYRKNPLDSGQRDVVIKILIDRVDLTEAQANKVADRIDQQMAAAGYDELPSVEYFNTLFRALVKKIVAAKKAKAKAKQEPLEPEFEPAVEYKKPILYKGRIDNAEDAINALSFMVDVLHDEGPVKGGGAAQRAEEARSNSRRRVSRRPARSSRRRVSRRSARRNPYRSAAPVRGYRTNPYLPADQDPLSIYRARLNRPGKAPLTSLEHLRAARLLRSHVQGSQNPPDFDKAQINQMIAILTGTAIDENEAGKYGWNIPKEEQRLGVNDYLIVHPESGSVQYDIDGFIAGLLVWKWSGGSSFGIRFPHYEDPDAEDTEAVASEETIKNLRLAPPGEKNVGKGKLLNVYRFADAMQEKGYKVQIVERARGQYIGLALLCETSAGKDVALAFMEAGKTLKNKSLQEFGIRLGVAWRSWASVSDENVRRAIPGGGKIGVLSAEDVEKVSTFYSELVGQGVPNAAGTSAQIERDGGFSVGKSNTVVSENILGAAAVIDAVRGKTDTIIGIPAETANHPVRYFYEPKPGETVVRLPGGCLPFALVIEGADCAVHIGIAPKSSDASRQDALKFRKAFEYKATTGWSRARVWPRTNKDSKSKGSPKPIALKYKTTNQQAKKAATADLNKVLRFPMLSLGLFAEGLDNLVTQDVRLKDDSLGLFAGSENDGFYELNNAYTNRPKVFDQYSDGGYLFLPVVVAMYRGMLGLGVGARTDTDSFGDTFLTLALSEASPTPFIAEGMPVPVGAGRIDPIKVKSLATGKTIEAPGLDPELKKAIKTLLPPPSFQYRFYETVAGKVGEMPRRVPRSFTPYPYQQIGIAFLHAAMCRGMIGDEMGLGKTIQALGALSLDPSPTTGQSMLPALIICPASVVGSWLKECKRWLPHLSVKEAGQNAVKADISVMSWGMVSRHWAKHEGRYNTVIVDEAHYGKRLYKKKKKDKIPTLRELNKGKITLSCCLVRSWKTAEKMR
jgi:hypothetical protein